MQEKNKWKEELNTRPISIDELFANWEEIFGEIDKLRAEENFKNWKMTVMNISNNKIRRNSVFSDFVNLEMNPWAKWDNMPENLRLLVIMNNIQHVFTNEV
jgi:hypothetical protein